MNRKVFTPDVLVDIGKNPYVKSAITNTIHFTVAFKEKFLEQYEKGMSPADIVLNMGFWLMIRHEFTVFYERVNKRYQPFSFHYPNPLYILMIQLQNEGV